MDFSKEVSFEQKCKEKRELIDIWRKSLPSRGNTAWPSLRRNMEASVPGAEGWNS